jgi:hypothetical protein
MGVRVYSQRMTIRTPKKGKRCVPCCRGRHLRCSMLDCGSEVCDSKVEPAVIDRSAASRANANKKGRRRSSSWS